MVAIVVLMVDVGDLRLCIMNAMVVAGRVDGLVYIASGTQESSI